MCTVSMNVTKFVAYYKSEFFSDETDESSWLESANSRLFRHRRQPRKEPGTTIILRANGASTTEKWPEN
jgi:hypothetical protein